jgi:hypothetical protein
MMLPRSMHASDLKVHLLRDTQTRRLTSSCRLAPEAFTNHERAIVLLFNEKQPYPRSCDTLCMPQTYCDFRACLSYLTAVRRRRLENLILF